jgi:hypothetical protein
MREQQYYSLHKEMYAAIDRFQKNDVTCAQEPWIGSYFLFSFPIVPDKILRVGSPFDAMAGF